MRGRIVAWMLVIAALGACSSDGEKTKGAARATTANLTDVSNPAASDTTRPAQTPGETDAASATGKAVPGARGGSAPASAAAGIPPTPGIPGAPSAGAARTGAGGPPIKIGAVTVDYAGLQNVKGYNTGSPTEQAKAVVAHLNRHGGIAGRRIELVTANFPATSSNIAAEEQAMCATFTEDHKVAAVVYGLVTEGRSLVPCLARKNVPLINSGGGGLADEAFMAKYPRGYYMPGSMNLTRLSRAYIDGLADQGFFAKGSKVGLIRVDDDPFKRATDEIVKPRLTALGLKLEAEAAVAAQTSLARSAAQMPNIVLRFQQAGVNRVLILDNAMLAPLFAIQAAGQNYYPRYGLNSLALPNTTDNNVPAVALRDAVGVGWQPALDVAAANDDSPPNAAAAACAQIMTRAGQGGVDRTGEWQQRLYCDEFFFLQAALAGAGQITPDLLAAKVAGFGTSFQSTQTFATRFAASRHDGAAQVRNFAFKADCSCFRYTSRPKAVA